MATIQKKKLCWNCEGNVSVEDETCPYCGVSVIPASLDGAIHPHNPPYQMSASKENAIPHPPYFSSQKEEGVSSQENSEEESDKEDDDVSVREFKHVVLALLFLLAGSIFFLFGLVLVLFSRNGIFTLQWDASHWFIYASLSIPLLFLGWRTLLKFD